MREITENTAAMQALLSEIARLRSRVDGLSEMMGLLGQAVRQSADSRWYRLTEVGRMLRKDSEFVRAGLERFGLPIVRDSHGREAISHTTWCRLEASLDREAASLAARERIERVRQERERNRVLRLHRKNQRKEAHQHGEPGADGGHLEGDLRGVPPRRGIGAK